MLGLHPLSALIVSAGKHCIAFDDAHQNTIKKCCLPQATGLEDCEEQPTQTPGTTSSIIIWQILLCEEFKFPSSIANT